MALTEEGPVSEAGISERETESVPRNGPRFIPSYSIVYLYLQICMFSALIPIVTKYSLHNEITSHILPTTLPEHSKLKLPS